MVNKIENVLFRPVERDKIQVLDTAIEKMYLKLEIFLKQWLELITML